MGWVIGEGWSMVVRLYDAGMGILRRGACEEGGGWFGYHS